MVQSGTSGGADAAGGFFFQAGIAAWAAVSVLAARSVTPSWGLNPTVYFTEVRCETGLPVDDILIITSESGGVYLQAKRGIALQSAPESPLGSTIGQFVKHFLSQRHKGPSESPWERALDPERDRLVLVTSGKAASWATTELPDVLDRFRLDARHPSLTQAAKNKVQRRAAEVFTAHARAFWHLAEQTYPSERDLRELFSVMRVDSLDVRIDGSGYDDTAAMNTLREAVLSDPAQAETAYKLLKEYCGTLVAKRNGANRDELQRQLVRHSLAAWVPMTLPAL